MEETTHVTKPLLKIIWAEHSTAAENQSSVVAMNRLRWLGHEVCSLVRDGACITLRDISIDIGDEQI